MLKKVLFLFLLIFFPFLLYSHSGRTDKNGGHHDTKNGGYHYHNSNSIGGSDSQILKLKENEEIKINQKIVEFDSIGSYINFDLLTKNYGFGISYNLSWWKIVFGCSSGVQFSEIDSSAKKPKFNTKSPYVYNDVIGNYNQGLSFLVSPEIGYKLPLTNVLEVIPFIGMTIDNRFINSKEVIQARYIGDTYTNKSDFGFDRILLNPFLRFNIRILYNLDVSIGYGANKGWITGVSYVSK